MFCLPEPGGLDHLIDRAITFAEEALAEAKGDVEDDFSFLIGNQLLIVAVRRQKARLFLAIIHGRLCIS